MSLIKSDNSQHTSKLYSDAVILEGHKGAVLSAKFSPDGQRIASAGMDRTILLWNLPTSANKDDINYGVVEGHKGGVTSVNWLQQNTLFSTSADSTVSFWDAESGQRIRTGRGHAQVVNDGSVSSDGTSLSVGDDGSLRLWDEREKHEVLKIETPYPLLSCDISADGKTAFVAGIDPAIRAYDVSTGKLLWSCVAGREIVTGLALSSDQSMLTSRSMDGSVRTISAKSFVPEGVSRVGQKYEGILGGSQQVPAKARFSKDDVYICSGSEVGSLNLWSTASRRTVSKFTGNDGAIVDVDFHPTEKMLMSTSTNGRIVVRQF